MENLDIIIKGVPESTRDIITGQMAEFYTSVQEVKNKAYSIHVTSVEDVEAMEEAAYLRKKIKNARINSEKKRKELKEVFLRPGQIVDKLGREIRQEAEKIEKYLWDQENFASIQEEAKKEEVKQSRVALLQSYVDDTDVFDLKNMSNTAFNVLLDGMMLAKRKEQENIRMQKEIETIRAREEEIKKIKEQKEIERIKEENKIIRSQLSHLEPSSELTHLEPFSELTHLEPSSELIQFAPKKNLSEKEILFDWIDRFSMPELNTDVLSEKCQEKIADIFKKFSNFKEWAKKNLSDV
ncbi:MAG: hypothetical protein EOL88_06425 [Bacteroidia bacterium]|nr:hypothetical protein [Bacteroidia bacterium]